MNVAIFRMYNERGHLLPAFSLARKLQESGVFRAVFVAERQFEQEIRARGFLFEEEFPFESPQARDLVRDAGNHPSRLVRLAHVLSGVKHDLALAFLKFSRDLVTKYEPSIVFVDELLTHYVIALHREPFPVVTLSTYLLSLQEPHLPPPNSVGQPALGLLDQIQNALQWQSVYWRRWLQVVSRLARVPGADYFYGALSEHAGYPRSERMEFRKYFWVDDRVVDKLVLCPPFLDFPRAPRANVHFVDSCVDSSRLRGDFDASLFGNPNPIVYCAFGTQSHKDAEVCARFLGSVIRAFANLPDVNLVVATAGVVPRGCPGTLPRNVRLFDVVSQLDVLVHARLMITHGGLGSVKECIHTGVPLLVYPLNLSVDQPGNAARVALHRIGLCGDPRRASEQKIAEQVRELLDNGLYRRNVGAMQRRMHDWDSQQPFLQFVEAKLPGVFGKKGPQGRRAETVQQARHGAN